MKNNMTRKAKAGRAEDTPFAAGWRHGAGTRASVGAGVAEPVTGAAVRPARTILLEKRRCASRLPRFKSMKTMQISLRLCVLAAAGGLMASSALAQMPGGSPAGINAALTQLFGKNNTFTAKAAMQVLDKDKKELASGPLEFAMSEGNVRVDVDIGKLKSDQIPAAAAASLKQMGMERIASVFRADKQAMYLIYPSLEVCVDSPLPKAEAEALLHPPKLTSTELGKEVLDGVAVVKNKLSYTDAQGVSHDAYTWTAPSLKGFPLQVQTEEKGNVLMLRFSDVKLTKPEAKLFEIPAGYTKYADMQAMTMGVMKKMMNSGGQ